MTRKAGTISNPRRSLFRKIDYYFAINPVFAESFREQIGLEEKIILTPQGVDYTYFVPARQDQVKNLRTKLGIQEEDFVILSVGFLTNRKGFSTAFKVLHQLSFDFKYIIAGEYDFGRHHFMLPYARQAIEIRNSGIEILGDSLFLTGPVENILEYYQCADLILINSKTEGLPNTLLEAMACGGTALIKEIPGISYLVEHLKTGIIFRNEQEMKDWIIRLHDKPDLRKEIGNNAMKYIHTHASFEHAWERISRRLTEK
jgi:glycosyltransferase involved in cell wall biosynthesis